VTTFPSEPPERVDGAPTPPPIISCPEAREPVDAKLVIVENHGIPPCVPLTPSTIVPAVVIGELDTVKIPLEDRPTLVTVPVNVGACHVATPGVPVATKMFPLTVGEFVPTATVPTEPTSGIV
jgi:hypothetical protein